jgi:diaminopimelate decarboxylase
MNQLNIQYIDYNQQDLHIEQVKLADIAAEYGTPAYIYSKKSILERFSQYTKGLEPLNHLVCYAVKANSNLAILNLLAKQGSGFDVVSGGELARVLTAGATANKVVFSGVGKTTSEITQAIKAGIYCFNVESIPELQRINEIACTLNTRAPVSLRVNPNIDAKTHPYISTGLTGHKFGIAYTDIIATYQLAQSLEGLKIIGISCHIGSQLEEISPFVEAIECVLKLVEQLASNNIELEFIDIGGGLGVSYANQHIPSIADYTQAISAALATSKLKLIIEPGRSLVAAAGVLVTKVEYLKPTATKNFAIVDAAMNDLMRPCLYQAQHQILPLVAHDNPQETYDIVGPVCESSDVLAKDVKLDIKEDDLLAILHSGAYGLSMSSNYNTRARAAEILVDGNKANLIREREELSSLWQLEHII